MDSKVISSENIIYHEFVGLKIKILQSSQKNIINLLGSVIFETKNMLILRTQNGIKKIPKKIIHKCKIYLLTNTCFISGNYMIGRPEDRLLKIKR